MLEVLCYLQHFPQDTRNNLYQTNVMIIKTKSYRKLGFFIVSVKDNWKVDNVQISANKGGSGFMMATPMTKLESDNSFNITGEHRYFFHFEDGLDAEAYLFTFVAEDEEGNNSVRKTSISVV